MFAYSDVLIKLVIGFLFITVLINLTGKSNLAPTSAMDQIQNYVLGGIVGGVLYNPSITLIQFIIILLIWSLLILIMRYVTIHSQVMQKFLNGDPVTVVRNGEILVENCLRANLPAKEVALKLRMAGVTDVTMVKRAVLEQSGQLTIVNQGDANIKFPVITDGTVDPDVLDLMEKDQAWLEEALRRQGIERIKDVYLAEFRNNQLVVAKYHH
ncbi:DUF421 domain-containing protein [Lactobacillus sp. LC28-10]|uniref:DUF421 domain-containing protein n=1 Tax=Secundilactobacillus angelensis TaxID=2722706 RepID=A0ABX1KX93_9LACO|nr:DUF421 domain-containing protein [Secundilactobacillus angelensis]MCH5461727.1 DUF421 domain-containing protein [Secundilactobacillus angelensis]NLR18566.1 DUF421 domain-containing protein [Secundilactobacillus angelensis]